jgi:flagellin
MPSTTRSTLSAQLANIGDSQTRLTFKQENLQVSMTNYEAARSRISDADFAKEQMELVKLQILQQTGTAALAQANAAPQSILSLIG